MVAIKIEGDSYKTSKFKGPDNKTRYTKTCGDLVAEALLGVDMDGLKDVMHSNGLGEKYDSLVNPEREKKLNNGQVRMLCGQSIRSALKNGTDIVIGDNTITSEAFLESRPELKKKEKTEAEAEQAA